MPTPEPQSTTAPQQLTVALQRQAAVSGWQVDVLVGAHRRHFDTLPALIAWLTQLDNAAPPPQGIR